MRELTEAAVRAAIVSCSETMDGVAVKLGVTVTKLWRFIFSMPYYRKRLERRMDELGQTLSDPIDSAFAQALRQQKPWVICFQAEVAFEFIQKPPEDCAECGVRGVESKTAENGTESKSSENCAASKSEDSGQVAEKSTIRELTESVVYAALIAWEEVINLTVIAARFGVKRNVLWNFIRGWPKLLETFDSGRQYLVDLAEHVLNQAVSQCKAWAVKFMFETKLRDKYSAPPTPAARPMREKPPSKPPQVTDPARPATESPAAKRPPRSEDEKNLKKLWSEAWKMRFAAQKLGVSPAQLLSYIILKPELQAAIGDQREELVDDAETRLSWEVFNQKSWGTCLVLETLGRELGYVKDPPFRWKCVPRDKGRPSEESGHQFNPSDLAVLLGDQCEASARVTEARLRAELNHNEPWIIKFVLMKLGQSRGYIKDRPKRRTAPPEPTPVGVPDPSRLTPEQRAEYEQLRAIGCDLKDQQSLVSTNAELAPALEPAAPARVSSEPAAPARVSSEPAAPARVSIEDERSERPTPVAEWQPCSDSQTLDAKHAADSQTDTQTRVAPAIVASPDQVAAGKSNESDDKRFTLIPASEEENLDILDPTPIVPDPAGPGEVDWSKFSQQELIEFEHLFARVYGMEDKRAPFRNRSNIRSRILKPEPENPGSDESGDRDDARPPPDRK